MSPHCSAIFLQHSRSVDVIAVPGNTHAATGSAASISARAKTPSLINSFNITSLSTTDSKTQQARKGFRLTYFVDVLETRAVVGNNRDLEIPHVRVVGSAEDAAIRGKSGKDDGRRSQIVQQQMKRRLVKSRVHRLTGKRWESIP